ncbi:MAG TPA: hypothetical protein VHY37_00760 [Tepidisphaeraceae bacterium]|nr:hypothetical protein [Tepidisphaeraceae bacterium]
MDERELQAHVRNAYNLRIGPAMGRYVMQKMQAQTPGRGGVVAVIGGDALTGRPKRTEVSLAQLAGNRTVNPSELP